MQHHNYSLSDLENMMPWEREIYLDMLVTWIKEQNEKQKQREAEGNKMSNKEDEGKLELSLRVLGNEIIGFKMIVDDFKMKWMLLGLVAIVGLSWAMGTYGPMLMQTFKG